MTEPISAPIIVAHGEDCEFYRTTADALGAGLLGEARAFDAEGRRLVVMDGALQIAPEGDGAAELAGLLRAWLGYMDALRESTANWTLALLVRASVAHLGYS